MGRDADTITDHGPVTRELARDESWRLLASVPYGRVVFTHHALPAVRPVNHLVEDGRIVIRSHPGAAVVSAAQQAVVVAYQADHIDPVRRHGWSVVVTGIARLLWDPELAARYRQLLHPWAGTAKDQVITISAEVVTGLRLEPPVTGEATDAVR